GTRPYVPIPRGAQGLQTAKRQPRHSMPWPGVAIPERRCFLGRLQSAPSNAPKLQNRGRVVSGSCLVVRGSASRNPRATLVGRARQFSFACHACAVRRTPGPSAGRFSSWFLTAYDKAEAQQFSTYRRIVDQDACCLPVADPTF